LEPLLAAKQLALHTISTLFGFEEKYVPHVIEGPGLEALKK
jgi:hypothetical protein